eukprot:CAMPEP_0114526642 /NCGR_PEP_ID=MMETSP0109-20121206/23139_1 /TAXON_ID=29199 /ORGANISM="Chlorarachnion reptans, Strain CCCM449" /LENGTH=551 /DNA_ID=CAMNT_0001708449 /DNA_START=75 /DNA_END=1730 /DNA_ORIENTATION=-
MAVLLLPLLLQAAATSGLGFPSRTTAARHGYYARQASTSYVREVSTRAARGSIPTGKKIISKNAVTPRTTGNVLKKPPMVATAKRTVGSTAPASKKLMASSKLKVAPPPRKSGTQKTKIMPVSKTVPVAPKTVSASGRPGTTSFKKAVAPRTAGSTKKVVGTAKTLTSSNSISVAPKKGTMKKVAPPRRGTMKKDAPAPKMETVKKVAPATKMGITKKVAPAARVAGGAKNEVKKPAFAFGGVSIPSMPKPSNSKTETDTGSNPLASILAPNAPPNPEAKTEDVGTGQITTGTEASSSDSKRSVSISPKTRRQATTAGLGVLGVTILSALNNKPKVTKKPATKPKPKQAEGDGFQSALTLGAFAGGAYFALGDKKTMKQDVKISPTGRTPETSTSAAAPAQAPTETVTVSTDPKPVGTARRWIRSWRNKESDSKSEETAPTTATTAVNPSSETVKLDAKEWIDAWKKNTLGNAALAGSKAVTGDQKTDKQALAARADEIEKEALKKAAQIDAFKAATKVAAAETTNVAVEASIKETRNPVRRMWRAMRRKN